jgi:hypothetical protein
MRHQAADDRFDADEHTAVAGQHCLYGPWCSGAQRTYSSDVR